MRSSRWWALAALFVLPGWGNLFVLAGSMEVSPARRIDAAYEMHGVRVEDPYQWLENVDSDEVEAWAKAQDALARDVIGAHPARPAIEARVRAAQEFPVRSAPVRRGDRTFVWHRAVGLQANVLFTIDDDGELHEVFDANRLSEGDDVGLGLAVISPDGRYLAYSLGTASAWKKVRVFDVETGETLPDVVVGLARRDLAWSRDGRGFFYSRFDAPAPGEELTTKPVNNRLCYHALGTDQDDDRELYRRPDRPAWILTALRTSENGRWLIFHPTSGSNSKNALYALDLATGGARPFEIAPDGEGTFLHVGDQDDRMWIVTDWQAPNQRVMQIDLLDPARDRWSPVIDAAPQQLYAVSLVADHFFCVYTEAGLRSHRVFDLRGQHVDDLELTDVAAVLSFAGQRTDEEVYYRYSSIGDPGSVRRYDLATRTSEIVWKPEEVRWDPDDFVTRQVFYASDDGTEVPMFVSHHRALEPGADTPALVYGYGAFGWSAYPWFTSQRIVWMQMGGVFAVANIRGGGERGNAWWEAGRVENKPQSYADFTAALRYLLEEGYTSPAKLAVQGGSASGMLPAVVANQHPELFAAGILNYPIMEMIRFPQFTGGARWLPEFGDPSVAAEFEVLRSYSPYHNLREGASLPAMLVSVGDRDDIAHPMHGYKYVAAAQAAQGGDAPILLRMDWGHGHYPSGVEAYIQVFTDQLAFLAQVLDIDVARSPRASR